MKNFYFALAGIVVAAIAAPLVFLALGDRPAASPGDLPWQIETLAGGDTRVFGLTPGRSTLLEAKARFGPDLALAVVAEPNEAGTVEAYYAQVNAGFVTGALILTAALPPATIADMRERAVKTEYMGGTTRRAHLHADDVARALQAPVAAIAFIPSVNLDEATVLQRFGPPAERRRSDAHSEHLLYPAKGLDLVLDSQGKELLQYVAPRDFERLRRPLLAAAAVSGAAVLSPAARSENPAAQ